MKILYFHQRSGFPLLFVLLNERAKENGFCKPIRLYVLSFLKRKYERKQFRRHILLKDHLKKFKAELLCHVGFTKAKAEVQFGS